MKEYPIVRNIRGSDASRGRVLLDFIVDPFLPTFSEHYGRTHGNFWKTKAIVGCLTDLGFQVDVTDWRNMHAPSASEYDLVIGQGRAFEQSCRRLSKDMPRVFLGWGLYAEATSAAIERRAKDLFQRRGFRVSQGHDVDYGALMATDIIYVGNNHTRESYAAVTCAPCFAVPNPVVDGVVSTVGSKDWKSARRRFMWMAAYGTLRRSLDVVLEVFAKNPEFELWICGDISHEKAFFQAYRKEILDTPNIHYQGWVDVATDAYRDVTRSCGYILYPSVSDGMPGSVVNAMASGVVPIVTEASGMECGGFELNIEEITEESILKVVQEASEVEPSALEHTANGASEFSLQFYSQQAFRTRFAAALGQILERHAV